MKARGGKRKVHAVAYSFDDSGDYGWFCFARASSAEKAANMSVDMVVSRLVATNRLDQVDYKTGLTIDELADIYKQHYANRRLYLFSNVSNEQLM